MPKVHKNIAYLKCSQCRKDRQKCLPEQRAWPGENCERCKKYGYRCSEGRTKAGESSQPAAANMSHSVRPVKYAADAIEIGLDSQTGIQEPPNRRPSKKRVNQCLEELGYLQWLSNKLKLVHDRIKHFKDSMFHPCWSSEFPQLAKVEAFIENFDIVYQNAIHHAANLAIEGPITEVSSVEAIGNHILSYTNIQQGHDAFLSRNQDYASFLVKIVAYHEGRGNFLAAQINQERLLDLVEASRQPAVDAIQKLVELYKKSSGRLEKIACNLGLDLQMTLRVSPLLHQVVCRDSMLLTSVSISQLDGYGPELDILGRTAIHCAAESNASASLCCLMQENIDLSMRDSFKSTGLEVALGRGHVEIVKFLDLKLADVNADIRGHDGRVALQTAIDQEYLPPESADINAPDLVGDDGRTTLQTAAEEGNLEVVKYLISKSVEVNADPAADWGRTALQAAAEGGHLEVVKYLVSESANVNADPAIYGGRTALQAAAEKGHLKVVEYLVLESADVNADPAIYGGRTALQAAAEKGHLKVVEYLVLESADVNADPAADCGRTALQAAAEGGNLEVVKYLISKSADVNANPVADRGRTALQAAAEKGHLEVVKYLVSRSADVNADPAGDWGRTALQAAAGGGYLEIVKYLISESANVNANQAIYGGRTALQSAIEGKHLEVVKLLVEQGASIFTALTGARGPMIFDIASDFPEMMEILSTYLSPNLSQDLQAQ